MFYKIQTAQYGKVKSFKVLESHCNDPSPQIASTYKALLGQFSVAALVK